MDDVKERKSMDWDVEKDREIRRKIVEAGTLSYELEACMKDSLKRLNNIEAMVRRDLSG